MEDPKQAKGIVKRDITRVVSRGTVTDDSLLDPSQSNYLAALALDKQGTHVGLAWVDVSTGTSRRPHYRRPPLPTSSPASRRPSWW